MIPFSCQKMIRLCNPFAGTDRADTLFSGFIKLRLALYLTVIIILMAQTMLLAEDNELYTGEKTQKNLLNFICDRFVIDNKNNSVEFSGNVKGILEDMVINAQLINILLRSDLSVGSEFKISEDAIKQIVASNNVTITFDNKIARADKAVYNANEKVLVLSGEPVTVTMGEDSVTGTRMIYNRIDERIVVEGGKEKQVNAVFHSGNKKSE